MWQKVLLGVLVGVITFYIYKTAFKQTTKRQSPLHSLQNALLTYALMQTRRNDMDEFNMDYSSFDGTKLPMFSGASLTNACFSYIVSKTDLRSGPWYSKVMEDKADAIRRYLDKQFDTNEKVVAFFEAVVEQMNANAQVHKPKAEDTKTDDTKDQDDGVLIQDAESINADPLIASLVDA